MNHQCRSLAAKAYLCFAALTFAGIGYICKTEIYSDNSYSLRDNQAVVSERSGLEDSLDTAKLATGLSALAGCLCLFNLPKNDS